MQQTNEITGYKQIDRSDTGSTLAMFTVCLVIVVMTFSAPLQVLLVDNIHIVFIVLITICSLFFHKRQTASNIASPYYAFVAVVIFYFIGSAILYTVGNSLSESLVASLVGAAVYLIPLICWFILLSPRRTALDIDAVSTFIVVTGAVIALFGLYQLFFDSTLFGIMDKVNNVNSQYVSSITSTRRSTSFLQSYQAYSAYLVLSTVLLLDKYQQLHLAAGIKPILLILFLIAGALSGSKLYAICLIASILFMALRRQFQRKRISTIRASSVVLTLMIVAACGFSLYILASGSIASNIAATITRVFSGILPSTYSSSVESVRFAYITELFHTGNVAAIIFGNGLGSSSYTAAQLIQGITQFTTESYLMSIWYEMGLAGLVCYLMLVVVAIRKSLSIAEASSTACFCFLICSFVSPALYSYALFPFWLYIVLPYRDTKRHSTDCRE